MQNNPHPKSKENRPLAFEYPISETIKLEAPSNLKPINFWDVINDRRSIRKFRQLSLNEIGYLLWTSAKVKNLWIQENGYILTLRPSASAGARHPIDILIASPILENNSFLYYYNPFEHSLNKLALSNEIVKNFLTHIESVLSIGNGTVIWFIAHPSRTSSKYVNPLSLIWRDAGTLIHSVQVAGTGLGINSCPVGTLGEPYITELFSSFGNIIGVGGLICG